jgi:hypothetical protein
MKKLSLLFIALFTVSLAFSLTKGESKAIGIKSAAPSVKADVTVPTVTTTAASGIASSSATLGGEVTSDGGATVDESGIVYSTTDATPTIEEGATKIAIGSGTGSFSQIIGSLSANTTYYYNSYAHNAQGNAYGTASGFYTLPTATAPAAGDGTSSNPYQIATLENLAWLAQTNTVWTSYFIQTADIDASSTTTWYAGNGFLPIGEGSGFNGYYNGNGHVISGLYINRPSEDHRALFRTPGSNTIIQKLGLSNCTIKGQNFIGGIASALFDNAQVSQCFVTGSVTCTGQFVAGITALHQGKSINDCYFMGSLSGSAAGGIVSWNKFPINRCYTTYHNIVDNQNGGSCNNCFSSLSSSTTVSKYTDAGWDFAGETTNGTEDIWALSPLVNSGYPCFTWQSIAVAPDVSTQEVGDIAPTTATANATLTTLGFPNPSYGVCYGTSPSPTISDNVVSIIGPASATGAYTASLINLSANTTYYVRSYATNSTGTVYGSEVHFTTSVATGIDDVLNTVSVYPNPASEYIAVKGVSGDAYVFDVLGKVVLTQKVTGDTRIPVNTLAQGIYYLHIGGENIKFIKR